MSVNMFPYYELKETFINMETSFINMPDARGRFKKGEHWRTPKPFWKKEWLYDEYIIKGKSSSEIANEMQCTDNNILFWLQKHKIKTRNVSEARKLKYWGSSGEDNPMFNKRGESNPHWKGGITPERQLFYTSQEWKDACAFVWKRDEEKCRRCFIKKEEGLPFVIHHIIPFRNKETRADVSNLLLLCKVCHDWVHSKKNTKSEFISSGGVGIGVGN